MDFLCVYVCIKLKSNLFFILNKERGKHPEKSQKIEHHEDWGDEKRWIFTVFFDEGFYF